MTRRYTLAHLSAIEMDPPRLIHAAGAAGFDAVGLRLLRVTADSPGYPLMEDHAMMRATLGAMAATGVGVSDIEFVKLDPQTEVTALQPMLECGAALGAKTLITAPYDPDLSRLGDRLSQLSDLSQAHGIQTVLEFFPWTSVPDLATCWQVVQAAGPQVGMLVDSLHFDRSGSGLDMLAQIPPQRLPFAHLCDAPVHDSYSTQQLIHTAREDRLPPGQGQIDLRAFIAALPADLPLGLEVPMTSTGASDVARLTAILAAARGVVTG
ncbi:endonuclease [Thioclava sp. SK-1]|uniref:sugar phosphate isomerase/epimerase family protein n=1 Tax=Thioclava sp. SK-1 TaxID=1889770 RepID=UPI0008263EA7|nr:sugar phosphate isomerase/epimerase [Thioclava sp. SK-1]OCX67341.1 endonuclease [Thioclava sp. SK-1]